jgi:hypothetical protein
MFDMNTPFDALLGLPVAARAAMASSYRPMTAAVHAER